MIANPPKALLSAIYLSLLGAVSVLPNQLYAQQEGVEELTRGPLHEAFATSVSYDTEQGITVERQPPEMIDELPPDQRPAGDNVAWIPGYWGWDDDRSDFIWISGIWRNLPPGRQWVPGYWNASGARWQWTSGYWADEQAQEVTYLPAPPKALENGPNIDSPSDNDVWVSGNWRYNDDRYAWSPGYWQPAQENWVWVPGHYVWTPSGYVFVDGYWDYDVERRGMVFAPVHFERSVYSRPDYYYTPTTVIVANVFLSHLFVRPGYGHYYFGDYYEPRYRDRGWFASFYYHGSRRGYDSIYVQDRWRHRSDRGWEKRHRDNFEFYRNNESARPPQTWAALMKRPENERRGRRDNFNFAEPLNKFVSNREDNRGMKFQALDKGARDRIVSQRQDMRKFSRERQQQEVRRGPDRAKAGPGSQVLREKLQRSPVTAMRPDQLKGNDAPPPRKDFRNGKRDERGPGRGESAGNPGRGNGPSDKNGPGDRPPSVMPERRQDPGSPAMDRRKMEGPERRPQIAPTPDKKQEERPNRGEIPGREMKRTPEPREAPQAERKATPERRMEPPQQRKMEPQRKIEPERKVEPQRKAPEQRPQAKPQAPQQRPQAPQQRPQARPQAPQARPQAPQARPQAPQARPQAPQARPQAPQARPQAPQARPQAPQARPQAPQQRPQAKPQAPQKRPEAKPQGGGGGGERKEGKRGRD